MCGICGFYNLNGQTAQVAAIKQMCEVIKHRGPDDEGTYVDGSFGMGMRRLSIIDLDTGHQPISNENATVWTILNGEIYNYVELMELLKERGHIFKTKSDTEVLVHLYEEYQDEFVKHLRGMFSLAIWDTKKRELILARDPLGIKQIYFYRDAKIFIFGSEIKCILKILEGSKKINPEALNHYLSFLYFPDDLTIFDGINKLKPGHLLKITADAAISSEYWNLNNLQQSNIGFMEAQDEFLRLMNESMKLHLRSDVPLGIFLSGGIDSSIITALASKLTNKPLNTFTIGYNKEGSFYDEREYARIVARLFNTNHQEFLVNPDIEEAIFKMIGYFDEPFANSSAIPNYYISKAMREKVKVALSGLGGDEIAGGYERYAGMKLLSNFNKLPSFLKNIVQHSLKLLPDSKKGNYFADRCKRFAQAANLSPRETYYSLIASSNDNRKKLILSNSSAYQNSYDLFINIINNAKQSDILREMTYFDIVSYMTNDLLVLTDRTSMANSLEVRVPFLDHKLVEFMFQLPYEYKIKGMQKKYILKKVFRNVLPGRILFRKKQGFSTPLSVWLRKDLQSFAQNIFLKERVESTGVLNYNGIHLLLSEHLARKANHQGILFALMTFIIWHEMYLQGKGNNCSKC